MVVAQSGLRGAGQTRIYARIDYPFRVEHAPDAQFTERLQQLGAANRLGDLLNALSA